MNKIKFFIMLASIVLGSNNILGMQRTSKCAEFSKTAQFCEQYLEKYRAKKDNETYKKIFTDNVVKQACCRFHLSSKIAESEFSYAVIEQNYDLAKFILNYVLNVNKFHDGIIPLIYFIPHLQVVQMLVELKADVDVTDKSKCTALMHAAKNNIPGVVQFLLQNKANVDAQDIHGKTALGYSNDTHFQSPHSDLLTQALKLRNTALIRNLLLGDSKDDSQDHNGSTALHATQLTNKEKRKAKQQERLKTATSINEAATTKDSENPAEQNSKDVAVDLQKRERRKPKLSDRNLRRQQVAADRKALEMAKTEEQDEQNRKQLLAEIRANFEELRKQNELI